MRALGTGDARNPVRALAAPILALLLSACAPAPLEEVAGTRELMGTFVTITVLHEDGRTAQAAIGAAFDEIDRLSRLLHTTGDESEVGRLNRDGSVAAGPELRHLVERAAHYHTLGAGAFDVTVQPVLDLYRESFGSRGRPPSDEEIAEALARVGGDRIALTDDTVALAPGMKITLGGIAKGFAIDRAVAVLEKRGIERGLVNAGGDMRAIGSRIERPFSIALQNPRDRTDHVAVIPLADRAVATSGDYERYFEPTKKYHHIIDPRTGRSAGSLISATVVASRALDADALATAVFVLGPQAGIALVEKLDGVEALVITSGREILRSSGLETVEPTVR